MAGPMRKDVREPWTGQSQVEREQYQTRRAAAGGDRLSVSFQEPVDSTVGDIWKYSQRQSQGFNPEKMNEEVDKKRTLRQGLRSENRMSFAALDNSPAPREQQKSRTLNKEHIIRRSIGLLDKATGVPSTPGQHLQSQRTPGSGFKHSTYTPRRPTASQFDVSDLMGQTPKRSSLTPAPTFNLSVFDQTHLNNFLATPAAMQHSSMGLDSSAVQTPGGKTEDFTNVNINLLMAEDPGVAASEGLFEEFMKCFTGLPSPTDAFNLVAKYQEACTEQVEMLNNFVRKAGATSSYGLPKKFVRTVEVLRLLEQEKCTWRLIGSLYNDRQMMLDNEEQEDMDAFVQTSSEKDIMESFFQRNGDVRQHQIVVDWLEKNSQDVLRCGYDRAEFYSKSICWENTLHDLQRQADSGQRLSALPRMDPDAPIRADHPLADLDKEDEVRLLREVFSNIRAGLMDEAQRLCRKSGQAWRAATLDGWRLYDDPNINGVPASGELQPIVGNKYRDIWKAVCWRMAEDEKFNVYERAVYAALSGNLKELLPACNTWDDCLWAYFKVLVDRQVEVEIREHLAITRDLESLPDAYYDKELTPSRIFQELQSHPRQMVEMQSKERHHIIQKYIILGDIDALIEEMGEWISDDVNRPSHHLVRFMAHVVLFLQSLGLQTKDAISVAIIEAYVKDLIAEKHTKLVAAYTAQLPYNKQVSWYARFLEGIHGKEERQHCLHLAEEAGLDVAQITKTVVENIRTRDESEFMVHTQPSLLLEAATSAEDRRKIEATDWLVFDPLQRAEALKQSNAIIRMFLATKKHDAAKEVFRKIPTDSIDVICRNWEAHAGLEKLPAEDDNAIKEYLCLKAYLDALDSFNDWFEHYHNKRPLEPTRPENANFHELVRFEHEQKEHELELERWRQALDSQSKGVKDSIYNVLLFVNGGWMIDQRMDEEIDETRQQQLAGLRALCLPMLCFLLHTVLQTTEQYKECLALADIIASEEFQLYKVFRREELKQFLSKLSESSLCLLDQNLDPLGYELVS